MATTTGGVYSGGVVTPGSIVDGDCNAAMGLQRSKLATQTLAQFVQNLLDLRKWDALEQLLPATPATTYLGIVTGATYGSNPPQIQTGDLKTTTTTRRARQIIALPENYVAAGQVQIRCRAGMKTTVADTSAVILVEVYQLNDDGTLSAQLSTVSGSASINSLTLADIIFVLTTSGLTAGARLDVRVSITITDAATGTAVIGVLQSLALKCDVLP